MARVIAYKKKFYPDGMAGGGGGGSSSDVYTTDEQIIGTWIDGKPIYRKGFSVGALTYSSSWQSFAHNISNFDGLVEVKGRVKNADGRWYNITQHRSDSSRGLCVGVDTTYIYYMNDWLETTTNAVIFIEYTKTTD